MVEKQSGGAEPKNKYSKRKITSAKFNDPSAFVSPIKMPILLQEETITYVSA